MMLIKRFLLVFLWRRILWALLGGLGLFSIFDLMKASETLWGAEGSAFGNIFTYAVLRLPSLAVFLTPLAVLVGALGAFASLTRRNEIVAMRVSGLRLGAMIGWALAASAPLIALHAVLLFAVAPKTDYSLSTWMAEKGVEPTEETRPSAGVNISSGRFFIEAQTQSPDGSDLWSPVIVSLTPTGKVRSVATASRARVSDASDKATWRLENAHLTTFPADGTPVAEARGSLLLEGMPRRAAVRNARRPVEHLPLAALIRLAGDETRGATSRRELTAHAIRRVTAIGASLLMLLFAAPVAFARSRTGEAAMSMFRSVILAFAFMVVDRTLFSLCLAGHLNSAIAGAGASLVALPLALWFVARAEKQA